MSDEKEHNRHEQAAYEAALLLRQAKEIEANFNRYMGNLQAILPSVDPKPSDFKGCVE